MKNKNLQVLGLAALAAVGFTACDGLGKMVKNAKTVQYSATPNPVVLVGDSIGVTIAGKFPANYFGKNVVVTATPVVKYAGGEKTMKPITIQGETAPGTGTKIAYASGGSFSYTGKVGYEKGIEKATVELKIVGAIKTKTKEFPAVKVADGTIVTQLLAQNDEKPIFAKDAFVKSRPISASSVIYYLINQSNVRPGELTSKEMKEFEDFITNGLAKGFDFKNASISAYASPDGEASKNANLANERAESAAKALISMFKDKKHKFEAGEKAEFYNKVGKGEDWEGFKTLMEQSSIKDKELILRVLSMYDNRDQREKEIKNLSKTFDEVAEKVLPKLRRSMITLNGEEKSRSDEEISKLMTSAPDNLSVEELLYAAANLTKDLNTRLNLYKTAEKNFPNDWRGINNAGVIYLMQNKVTEADAEFTKAAQVDAANKAVKNNQGIVARWKGDRKKASELFKAAAGAGPEVSYNLGVIDLMSGNYSAAISNFGSFNTFNHALAKLLNGNADAANATLDASQEFDTAFGNYLKAIIAARGGKADGVMNNLKTAIGKDASLKAKAKDDAEFIKMFDNADFKALTN